MIEMSCHAEWKCDVKNGYDIAAIEEENSDDLEDICTKEKNKSPILGSLDDESMVKGTYWIEVRKGSKTCPYDLSNSE